MKRTEVIFKLFVTAIFTLAAVYFIWFVFFSNVRELISVIPDDSSYYLKIAKNFSEGAGFSFDGINSTNGFQPLWQIVLIPFFYFVKTSPENYLRAILIFQIILMSVSFVVFYNTLSKFFKIKIISAFAVCFIVFVFFNSVNGMETSLMVFLISVVFSASVNFNIFTDSKRSREFIWGMSLGFLILSRLDLIFFAVSFILLILFITDNFKAGLIKILIVISGMMIIISPYLLYNYINFGSVIPISGYLKNGFPDSGFREKISYILKYRETYFQLISMIYIVWFLFNFKKIKHWKNYIYSLFIAVLSLTNLFLFIYMIFLLNWVIFYWYFIPYSLFFSLFICMPLNYITDIKLKRIGNLIVYSFLIFITFYWGNKIYHNFNADNISTSNNWNIESYIASQWAKQNTDPSDVFAMKDAGHFGFFSKRNTINLDGLVNNFEYQNILYNKQLNDYLKSNNVKYFVQHAIRNRDDITSGNYDSLKLNFISHMYNSGSDTITLFKNNELYRSDNYYDEGNKAAFIIWKLS
ncbi:MAG TPA: hypothetical protein PKD83_06285 [Ignavibacteria bacterium]|nr:hypothetical protein [Ignavibacteria bacterium]